MPRKTDIPCPPFCAPTNWPEQLRAQQWYKHQNTSPNTSRGPFYRNCHFVRVSDLKKLIEHAYIAPFTLSVSSKLQISRITCFHGGKQEQESCWIHLWLIQSLSREMFVIDSTARLQTSITARRNDFDVFHEVSGLGNNLKTCHICGYRNLLWFTVPPNVF